MHDRHTIARCRREGRDAYLVHGPAAYDRSPYHFEDPRDEYYVQGMREAHEEYGK